MALHNQKIGSVGEDIAADYLVREHSMMIVERNWRSRSKELDIIAIKDFNLRIVEVKSRLEHSQESIAASLDQKKLRNLTQGASYYLSANNHTGLSGVYFDLVVVIFKEDGSHEVEYTPQFFTPSW